MPIILFAYSNFAHLCKKKSFVFYKNTCTDVRNFKWVSGLIFWPNSDGNFYLDMQNNYFWIMLENFAIFKQQKIIFSIFLEYDTILDNNKCR